MEKEYICPKCHGNLSIGKHLVFLGKNRNKRKGIVFLHCEVGNYSCHRHPSFSENSELVQFYCPLCHSSLASDIDDSLTHVLMNDGRNDYKVYFSKLFPKLRSSFSGENNENGNSWLTEKYTYFKMQDKFKHFLRM